MGAERVAEPFCAWCESRKGPFFLTPGYRLICKPCVTKGEHEREPLPSEPEANVAADE